MLSLGYGLSWGLFPQAGVPPRRLYRTLAPPFPRGPPGQGAWRFAQGFSIRLYTACRAPRALVDVYFAGLQLEYHVDMLASSLA